MGTAMLLPWGVWPQLHSIAIGAYAILMNVAFTTRAPDQWQSPAVGLVIAFIASVYAAYQSEQYRLAQRRLEDNLKRPPRRRAGRRNDRPPRVCCAMSASSRRR
jgi:hypothetical protein